jgi:hypothetical protein
MIRRFAQVLGVVAFLSAMSTGAAAAMSKPVAAAAEPVCWHCVSDGPNGPMACIEIICPE